MGVNHVVLDELPTEAVGKPAIRPSNRGHVPHRGGKLELANFAARGFGNVNTASARKYIFKVRVSEQRAIQVDWSYDEMSQATP